MRLLVFGLVLLAAVAAAGAASSPRSPRDLIVFVRENPRATAPNLGVDLWAVDPDGGKPRRFVGSRGWDEAPAWSPDGNLVAFEKSIFARGEPDPVLRALDIWTVMGSGRGLRNLTRDGSASAAAWSPDGRRLAFARGNGVFVVRRDGSRKRHIARRDDPGTPAWSPDGRRVAFTVPGELRVVGATGQGERLVARGAVSGTPVSWSPDGRWIAYSGAKGAALAHWRGGRQRALGAFVESAWSTDGRWIALVREGTPRQAGIFLRRAGGAVPRRLTRGLDTQPAWSPDSRRLAFRRGLLIGDIHVVGIDGRGLRNLTRTVRLDEREPAWRPR